MHSIALSSLKGDLNAQITQFYQNYPSESQIAQKEPLVHHGGHKQRHGAIVSSINES